MRKSAEILVVGLLVCLAAICASDGRAVGTWKLTSERILNGPAPTLALGSVKTYQQDASGQIVLVDKSGKPVPTPGAAPAEASKSRDLMYVIFSPDGRSMTETITSTEYKYYRVVRVWEKR
jgi:hypothetical protein